MTKKVNGVAKARNIAKVTEAKALAMKVAAKLNGKPTSKPKPKIDRVAERLAFIKQNATTILKAWDALPEGKRSASALNRALPKGWRNKLVDEVLMLAGLRQSGEEVVIKAVAEDKALLKDVVVARKVEPKANGKPKALVAREAKEAASIARFKESQTKA